MTGCGWQHRIASSYAAVLQDCRSQQESERGSVSVPEPVARVSELATTSEDSWTIDRRIFQGCALIPRCAKYARTPWCGCMECDACARVCARLCVTWRGHGGKGWCELVWATRVREHLVAVLLKPERLGHRHRTLAADDGLCSAGVGRLKPPGVHVVAHACCVIAQTFTCCPAPRTPVSSSARK